MPESETEKQEKQRKAEQIGAAVKTAGLGQQEHQGGQQLHKVIEGLGSVTRAIDALGKRLDALETGHVPSKAGHRGKGNVVPKGDDDDDDAPRRRKHDDDDDDGEPPGTPKRVVADDSKPWLRADAERAREAELADVQVFYDAIASSWGESAPPPMSGEQPINYRRRLARRWQRFSKEFTDTDLGTIADPTLRGIEQQIRTDALAASSCPASEGDRVLIPRTKRDETGRTITEWFGSPKVWMSSFQGQRRRVIGIRNTSTV